MDQDVTALTRAYQQLHEDFRYLEEQLQKAKEELRNKNMTIWRLQLESEKYHAEVLRLQKQLQK